MVKYRIQQEEKAETQRHEQELLELWQNTIDAEEEADHLEVKLNLAHKIIDIHEKMKIMVGDTNTYACIHTYIHAYIHTYMHTYTHAYTHAYTHTCTSTYAHTYTHTYIFIQMLIHMLLHTGYSSYSSYFISSTSPYRSGAFFL
jgi:hypothetical protein